MALDPSVIDVVTDALRDPAYAGAKYPSVLEVDSGESA
jgi:hypothetical protein